MKKQIKLTQFLFDVAMSLSSRSHEVKKCTIGESWAFTENEKTFVSLGKGNGLKNWRLSESVTIETVEIK